MSDIAGAAFVTVRAVQLAFRRGMDITPMADELESDHVGNGYGVSDAAIPYYTRMLGALDPRQAGRALRAFTDPGITSVLWSSTGQRQWSHLLGLLEPKLTLPADRALYDAVRAFTGPPHQLHADSAAMSSAGTRRLIR